jgi:hypothetical protein
MTPSKPEIKSSFETYVARVFPEVPKDSRQYLDLWATWIAGMAVIIGLLERPNESEEQALGHVNAVRLAVMETLAEAQERLRRTQ